MVAMENGDVEMHDGKDIVAILDAGAQYGKVIDRRVREMCIETEVLPLNTSVDELKEKGVKAVIVSGGPGSVHEKDSPNWDPNIVSSGIPLLGICYGMQLLNRDCGGKVEQAASREDGQFTVNVDTVSALYRGLPDKQQMLLTHFDAVTEVAPCLTVTAKCGSTIVGIENRERKLYGVQYHPEVDLTEHGKTIFNNFLIEVAGCRPSFTLESRQSACIEEIKALCGTTHKVLSLVSGGVDSAVCTALLHKAIGPERVVAIHIDNGFLRKNESEQVKESLEGIGLKLKVINAAHTFSHGTTRIPTKRGDHVINLSVGPLHSVVHPEEKRKIIGDTFMKVSDEAMKDLNLDPDTTLFAQGTLRPDLIESASLLASGKAHMIKTHHNDSQLVRELRKQGKVVEPLRDFHKDEVRQLGRELNLPTELVERHPFPGPGLAIRVLCAEEKYQCNSFSETSNMLGFIVDYTNALKKPHPLLARIQKSMSEHDLEELKEMSLKYKLTATLLPIKTVGVQGDCRTYSYVAALSSDENPNWPYLMKYAKIIPKMCTNVNRVVYVFGGRVKHPINEITSTTLTSNVLKTLRQVDYVANQVLQTSGYVRTITQMPIILIPIHFDIDPVSRTPSCQRSVVIRTFITNDFMTGVAAEPEKDIKEKVVFDMVSKIREVPGISRVMYDLTSKPPGTTEWE